MWAITPEGRATNLGEVLLNGSESKLNVTTELQAFGLVVTAEPYFAVSQPSDVVVMENTVRKDTRGAVEFVEAEYELLKRGTYMMSSNPADLPSRRLDDDVPLELYEARNAVHFARVAGADEYAESSFAKASGLLGKAEEGYKKDRRRRDVISAAREAAQAAEDSRLIALERRQAELVARDRALTMEREAAARATAAEAVRRAELHETQRRAVEANLEAAEHQRRLAENERAEADAARLAAERAKAEAQSAIDRLSAERADAEARAQAATQSAAQAERERAELRERLQQQLNIILETRESARGLIVNMSDVLFDYDRATLKPGAREKLARVAGVLMAYPGLEIEVEGHTDSMGTDEYNQGLSERRATSVREYLASQGIPRETIEAMGFGESRPVVGNETAAGRQRNRRVELVVSGEVIDVATNRRNE
jgi:outer membrane protein OmpA-like peptidoglycan-associated protein